MVQLTWLHTTKRKKCGMCKWFALVLSIEMCGCLFFSQFVFPRVNFIHQVIQLHSVQWTRKGALAMLWCDLQFVLVSYTSVCMKYRGAYICICMCNMTLVSVVQLPLRHVAWWECGAGLVRGAAAVWRSGVLLQRKAYVGLTGQAVQGSHQNEPFMRSHENRTCRHWGAGCIPCLQSKALMRNVLGCFREQTDSIGFELSFYFACYFEMPGGMFPSTLQMYVLGMSKSMR